MTRSETDIHRIADALEDISKTLRRIQARLDREGKKNDQDVFQQQLSDNEYLQKANRINTLLEDAKRKIE